MTGKSVYMVQRVDGRGYRRVTFDEVRKAMALDRIYFEGADGDEGTNVVTYWYKRLY